MAAARAANELELAYQEAHAAIEESEARRDEEDPNAVAVQLRRLFGFGPYRDPRTYWISVAIYVAAALLSIAIFLVEDTSEDPLTGGAARGGHELICDRHDVEITDQRLELGDCRAVLRLGETPNLFGGSERSTCLDHDEVHRRDCVGGGPDGHGALGRRASDSVERLHRLSRPRR